MELRAARILVDGHATGMSPWLLALCTCQACGDSLALVQSLEEEENSRTITGILQCPSCNRDWPILAGIPILVEDPSIYLARYRESVLATLAEFNLATSVSVQLIDNCIGGQTCEAMRFGDDWTQGEFQCSDKTEQSLESPSEAQRLYLELVKQDRDHGLVNTLLELLDTAGRKRGLVIEIGPGAGGVSSKLASQCERLLLVDLSLRSVLRSVSVSRNEQTAEVAAIVGDVTNFDMASECADALVAANVVDIVECPEEFLRSAARWLKAGGRFVLTSPEPGLGGSDEMALLELLTSLEFTIVESRDGIPWLREHSSRYAQLYWLQAICASI